MEVFDNTVARDLLRRNGIRVSSELTTRQRDEVRHYRRQGKVAFYKNGRLQVEKRQANPARDSRRSNGQRYINDDQDEGERMYHYYKRRSAQTSDSRQSSYYEERRTDQCHSSRFGGSKGDSLYRSGEKERDGDHDNNAWNNVRQQTSTDDNRGRHQHHHQDDNDWYERQDCNPALHRHHDPYRITVDDNHGMDRGGFMTQRGATTHITETTAGTTGDKHT